MEQVPSRRREYELHDECAEVFAEFVEDFITYTSAKMTRSELLPYYRISLYVFTSLMDSAAPYL